MTQFGPEGFVDQSFVILQKILQLCIFNQVYLPEELRVILCLLGLLLFFDHRQYGCILRGLHMSISRRRGIEALPFIVCLFFIFIPNVVQNIVLFFFLFVLIIVEETLYGRGGEGIVLFSCLKHKVKVIFIRVPLAIPASRIRAQGFLFSFSHW